jgi:hypothetical protein
MQAGQIMAALGPVTISLGVDQIWMSLDGSVGNGQLIATGRVPATVLGSMTKGMIYDLAADNREWTGSYVSGTQAQLTFQLN